MHRRKIPPQLCLPTAGVNLSRPPGSGRRGSQSPEGAQRDLVPSGTTGRLTAERQRLAIRGGGDPESLAPGNTNGVSHGAQPQISRGSLTWEGKPSAALAFRIRNCVLMAPGRFWATPRCEDQGFATQRPTDLRLPAACRRRGLRASPDPPSQNPPLLAPPGDVRACSNLGCTGPDFLTLGPGVSNSNVFRGRAGDVIRKKSRAESDPAAGCPWKCGLRMARPSTFLKSTCTPRGQSGTP